MVEVKAKIKRPWVLTARNLPSTNIKRQPGDLMDTGTQSGLGGLGEVETHKWVGHLYLGWSWSKPINLAITRIICHSNLQGNVQGNLQLHNGLRGLKGPWSFIKGVENETFFSICWNQKSRTIIFMPTHSTTAYNKVQLKVYNPIYWSKADQAFVHWTQASSQPETSRSWSFHDMT